MRRLSDRYRFGVTSPHTTSNVAILFSFRASEHSIRRLQKLLDRLTLFDQDKQKVRHLRRLTTAAREIVRNSRHPFQAHGTISNAIVVSRKSLLKGQLKASIPPHQLSSAQLHRSSQMSLIPHFQGAPEHRE